MADLKQITALIQKGALGATSRWQDKSFVNISHKHKFWAAYCAKHALTLPDGKIKNNLLEIASFVAQHPKMCYQDFANYFKPDSATVASLLDCFKERPGTIKYLERVFRKDHPNVMEVKWQWR